MGRIIKFRAWNSDEKEIIFWSGLKSQGYELSEFDDNGTFAHVFMQFTGLADKNGKEIYEGDIVAVVFTEDTDYEVTIYEVFFDEEEAMFKLKNKLGYCMLTHWSTEIEIIGNIYENPELIK